ncbi:MAG: BrnA antitoxin family protein [Janthinobacterium lividum]
MPSLKEDAEINAGIAADPDTFELTEANFAQARPAAEALPKEVYAELTKRRGRPPSDKPPKVMVSLRMAPDVLARWRKTGTGWQTRASEVLERAVGSSTRDYVHALTDTGQSSIGATTMKQPGLDGRHRDKDGKISTKHGNTEMKTVRKIYGDDVARSTRGDAKLSTVLKATGKPSLTKLIKGK